ncbi:MAG TPA: alpha/beta fold hydrolase [Gemmatimonadaceae bacterium]|nr:alpha/beta fold hydrolase [Gemmatimonadaceae bacterium]
MLRELTFPGQITATVADAAGDRQSLLLLIHGMFGGAWQFEEWQRRLAARGRSSVAIDLRGHGASGGITDIGTVSLADYVNDAIGVARELGTPEVVGHSMGGLVAQKLAEKGAVSAAVLICSAPPRWIPALGTELLARMMKYSAALILSRPLVPLRSDADALFLDHIPVAERDEIFARIQPESGRAARELALGAMTVDAKRVSCPVLSIGAADDHFLPPRIARATARKYDAEYREYAGHGHYIVGEPGWERVADDVAEWLATRALTLR